MSTDQGHLEWIYDRLRCKHGEPVNADYMLRFREIIGGFSRKEVAAVPGPNDWAQQHEADKLNYGLTGFLGDKGPADLTPEHSARPPGSPGSPEVFAAYRYVDSVVQHADAISPCGGHAWHGWALREAFLAGCTHHRENGGYIVPTVAEVAWKEAPPERLEQLSSATETLGQHLDELADEAFKRGSITTLKTLETALKKEWVIRLAFRIWPMIVLRKFRERIEEAPPLPAQASSEGLPADHSSELYPLG